MWLPLLGRFISLFLGILARNPGQFAPWKLRLTAGVDEVEKKNVNIDAKSSVLQDN